MQVEYSPSGSHHGSQKNGHVPSPIRQQGIHTELTMNDQTDAQLLDAFRAGDETAFTILAQRYQQAITAACKRQAPRGEIDDCVQAVFMVLVRRPAAAAQAPVLLAWFHRVAHFVCREALRAATRRKQMITIAAQPTPTGNPPEAMVLEHLDMALLRLEEQQRASVLLYASGYANDDIAKSLGVTSANASKLVQRGLAGLRDCLSRRGASITATALLALITTQHASAATAAPITIGALSSASMHVNSLAKGTLMHLTMTATSTWVIAASLAAAICAGGVFAAETVTPPPAPSGDQKVTPAPSPIIPAPEEEKKAPEFPEGMVAVVRNDPQGKQDLVMLILKKGVNVEKGVKFMIYRDTSYIVRVRVEKVLGDMVACRIIPDSWNTNGLQIQEGDLAKKGF